MFKVENIKTADTIQQEKNLQLIKSFTSKTEHFIQAKIDEYNEANGTAFGNVHNCESYSRIDGYTHAVFCTKVWAWSVLVWETVRQYQEIMTSVPTDEEFQGLLESVVF